MFKIETIKTLVLEFQPRWRVGRNASLPRTTKRRITTNLKTINNQKFQKINLHGTPTTKVLKTHSPKVVGGARERTEQREHAARQWTLQA